MCAVRANSAEKTRRQSVRPIGRPSTRKTNVGFEQQQNCRSAPSLILSFCVLPLRFVFFCRRIFVLLSSMLFRSADAKRPFPSVSSNLDRWFRFKRRPNGPLASNRTRNRYSFSRSSPSVQLLIRFERKCARSFEWRENEGFLLSFETPRKSRVMKRRPIANTGGKFFRDEFFPSPARNRGRKEKRKEFELEFLQLQRSKCRAMQKQIEVEKCMKEQSEQENRKIDFVVCPLVRAKSPRRRAKAYH